MKRHSEIDEPQKNSLLIFFIGVILPKDTERYRIHNLLLMKKKDFENAIRETQY